jgi:hypothetical protein
MLNSKVQPKRSSKRRIELREVTSVICLPRGRIMYNH